MRVYLRLGRSIGISMPWWLAWIPLLIWFCGLILAVFVWLIWMTCVAAVGIVQEARTGRRV